MKWRIAGRDTHVTLDMQPRRGMTYPVWIITNKVNGRPGYNGDKQTGWHALLHGTISYCPEKTMTTLDFIVKMNSSVLNSSVYSLRYLLNIGYDNF
jgi:hypothetical protein